MRRVASLSRWLLTGLTAAVLTSVLTSGVALAFDPNCRSGQCQPYQYGSPDLFANYYVNPACGGVGSQMYVSPGPIPAHVGHTYFTYQPLMPHEFMYPHHNTYHRYYNDGRGLTRTSVKYYSPPGKRTMGYLHHMFTIPR